MLATIISFDNKGYRALFHIANDIKRTWAKPSPYAVPYIKAMSELNNIGDMYLYDDARSIVLYFLSNASGWRGDDAKRIKAELKAML